MLWSCLASSVLVLLSLAGADTYGDEPMTADQAAAFARGDVIAIEPVSEPIVEVKATPEPQKKTTAKPAPKQAKPAAQPSVLTATSVWPVVPSVQLGLAASDLGVFPVAVVDAFVPIIPTIGPWVRVAAGGSVGNYGLLVGELLGGVGVGVEGQIGGIRGRVGAMPVVGVHAYSVASEPLPDTPSSPLPLLGIWAPVEVELPLGGGTHALAGATLGYTNAVLHRINGEDAFGRGRIYALVTFGLLFGGAP
jgi:hypothetical protein